MKKITVILFIIMLNLVNAKDKQAGSVEINYYIQKIDSKRIEIIFHFNIEKGWHIYWKNAGDSGIPTDFNFDLPNNMKLIDNQWSIPELIPFDEFMNVGYENEAYFKYTFEIIDNNIPDKIDCNIKWLICKEACYPDSKKMTIYLKQRNIIKNIMATLTDDTLFPLNKLVEIKYASIINDTLKVKIQNPINDNNFKKVIMLPYESGYLNLAKQQFEYLENSIEFTTPLDELRDTNPEKLSGLIIFENENEKIAYKFLLTLKGE